MKVKLGVFVLAASLAAFGQGRGHGMGGGMGQGPGMGSMGQSMGHGQGDMGREMGRGQGEAGHSSEMDGMRQQPLKNAQVNSGAFRMLESKTGMTADQLKRLYAGSGARNFGQFASAIIVSKNLNLDTSKVLAGLKTESLGKTIQSLGVDRKTAKAEVGKAKKQVQDAESERTSTKS